MCMGAAGGPELGLGTGATGTSLGPPDVWGPFCCVSIGPPDTDVGVDDVASSLFGCCCMAPRPPPSLQLPTSTTYIICFLYLLLYTTVDDTVQLSRILTRHTQRGVKV